MTDLNQLWQDEPTEDDLQFLVEGHVEHGPMTYDKERDVFYTDDECYGKIARGKLQVIPWSKAAALFKPQSSEPRIIPDAIIPTGDDGDMPVIGPPGSLKRKEQPEAFQVGDVVECVASYGVGCSVRAGQQYTIASVHRYDAGNCSVSVEDVWKRPGVLAEWLPYRFRLVHRPGRIIPESEVREAINAILAPYPDPMSIQRLTGVSIASRLGVPLEDNGK